MEVRFFSKKIIEWYQNNKRNLPWRETSDPYKIWLSEIILQQTRVSQGLPYYHKFVTEFPDVHALAASSEEKVLRLWQGLGYYTRARNLHACAKLVVKEFKGVFPSRYYELIQLPGIGEYTAAAIASIAGKEPAAVVDGNVFRVLARVFGIETPINSLAGKKEFSSLANQLIHSADPGEYNQAIMEFGALHCVPKNPKCDDCILSSGCLARQSKLQESLPVKIQSREKQTRYFYYFVVKHGKSIAMTGRQNKDIWKGLYEFYLVEKSRTTKPEKILKEDEKLKKLNPILSIETISDTYKHILSHQAIRCRFIVIKLKRKPARKDFPFQFYTLSAIHNLPKPVLISRFLHDFGLL
jgi:A/G-specific adenine glycosylase